MNQNRRHILSVLAFAGAAFFLIGCGGEDTEPTQCDPGEVQQARDGCNSCTCNDAGVFECTTEICLPCTEGETKTGRDGCSDCTCNSEGAWICDISKCAACPEPLDHECSLLPIYPRTTDNSQCCTYDSICALPFEAPLIFEEMPACAAVECLPGDSSIEEDGCKLCACNGSGIIECVDLPCSKCTAGDEKPAETSCNICVCDENREWKCGEEPCPKQCNMGDSVQAPDNCNTCSCNQEGQWVCGQNPCKPCETGSTKIAYDGCNTCVCDAKAEWECTGIFVVVPSMAFIGDCPVCEHGDTNTAYDECNTCVCDQSEADLFGKWECTKEPCTSGICPQAKEHSCPHNPIFTMNPFNEVCCLYDSPCEIDQSWTTFESHTECVCSTKEFSCELDCSETGYVKDNQGCETCECQCAEGETTYDVETCEHCTCFAGSWTCTTAPCDAICTPGNVQASNDNCNTCACTEQFSWVCTELDCTTPEDNICKPPSANECEKKDFWGQTPTGKCCPYDSACSVPMVYPKFASLEECQNASD